MTAIAEPAAKRQGLDIVEDVAQRIFALPELRLSQARRVDDHPGSGQQYKLTVAGHVPSLARALIDLARAHELGAQDGVDQCRLANPIRPQKHPGPRGLELALDGVDPFAGEAAGHDHGRAGGHRLELDAHRVDGFGDVGLGEDDHRRGAALPRDGQVALDATDVDVRGGDDDERDGDVRGQDLPAIQVARRATGEQGAAFDDAADVATVEHDPIADRGVDVPGERAQDRIPVVNQIFGAVVGDDPRGRGAGRRDLHELALEMFIPAQRSELGGWSRQLEIPPERRVGVIGPPGEEVLDRPSGGGRRPETGQRNFSHHAHLLCLIRGPESTRP